MHLKSYVFDNFSHPSPFAAHTTATLMEPSKLLLSCLFLLTITGYTGATTHYVSRPSKLFVFGDSYADTGNIPKSIAGSWREPYGITFPGKPSGRFSDGRLLTDYFARFLGLKTPVAYRWMNYAGKKLRNGMNFAYGGSGVFNTLGELLPNMTTQIGFFEKLLNASSLYTKHDLKSSVVLITLSGNDYGFYLSTGGTAQGFPAFITLVVNQLGVNIRRLRELGATKIAVAALQPIGCLPRNTQLSSFQQCNATLNSLVNFHNLLLQQTVASLNNQTENSTIVVLDLYDSFTTVLNRKQDSHGLKFKTPLTPCCTGIGSGNNCGSVDGNGTKLYTLCSDPTSAFFWDSSHPTEAGWHAVYVTLKSTLEQFFKFH